MKVNELTTTLGIPTEFSKETLWAAALESFSLDQMGVRGKLGLVPRRVPLEPKDSAHARLELATDWYETDKESDTIRTQWLDLPSATKDRYCDCPDDGERGMVTTSVKLDVAVKALEAGSSLDLSTVFQQYKDNPSKPGKGKTTVCTSRGVLEEELSQLILERAAGHK